MKVFLSNFVNNFSRKKKLLFLFISDLFIFFLSHIISNYLREEIIWYSYNFYSYIFLFSLLATFISLYFFDIYQNFLRYTNLKIINQIFYSCLLYLVLFFSFLFYFNFYNFPRSIGIFFVNSNIKN